MEHTYLDEHERCFLGRSSTADAANGCTASCSGSAAGASFASHSDHTKKLFLSSAATKLFCSAAADTADGCTAGRSTAAESFCSAATE